MPQILDEYRKFFVHLAISLFVGLICYKLYYSMQQDLNEQYESEMILYHAKRDKCEYEYEINECQPDRRRPALHEYCQIRETCMNTPPQAGVKVISAASGLLAEVINSFSERLTLTSTCMVLLLGIAVVYFFSHRSPVQQPVKLDLTVKSQQPLDA